MSAQLYVHGVAIDWVGFEQDYTRRKLILPTYPWQRERYWLDTRGRNGKTAMTVAPSRPLAPSQEHPLLGQRLPSALKQALFISQLSPDSPPYLAVSRVFGTAILPAAAYMEIALAAGSAYFKSETLLLEDMLIQQALILPDKAPSAPDKLTACATRRPTGHDKEQTVQLILTPEGSQRASFQIFSLTQSDEEEESWRLHVSGKLSVPTGLPRNGKEVRKADLARRIAQGERGTELSLEAHYQHWIERGIEYGPRFQAIERLWEYENEVRAQVHLPEGLNAEGYLLHPALLDGCFQLLGAALAANEGDETTYLPVALERLELYRPAGRKVWVQLQVRQQQAESLTVDLQLFDERGLAVASLSGLSCRRASPAALLGTTDWDDWLYRVAWQAQEEKELAVTLPSLSGQGLDAGTWLILADSGGVGQQLVNDLEERGSPCVLVYAGTDYEKLNGSEYAINPAEPTHFQRLLNSGESYRGVVHLWSLEGEDWFVNGCASALHLVQALAQATHPAPLWLVTRGAQAVREGEPVAVWQAPLWGLAQVISLEHPLLSSVRLDLAPDEKNLQHINALVRELLSPDDEDQVAYRAGVRYVARLEHYSLPENGPRPSPPAPRTRRGREAVFVSEGGARAKCFQVKLSSYGILDNLHLSPVTRKAPRAYEVEIELRATALNFRDVLNALGMLKEYYAEHLGIHQASEIPFGFECTGLIRRVGAGVPTGDEMSAFNVGDEVMASLAIGSLASFINVKAEFVVPKPKELTDEEATTIPTAFLTAYYGLYELAKIQPGERVLIHAAAGGVGQAAVQLAQMAGAEVFATASPAKWAFLQSVGVEHLMNSRALDFADEVMAITGGKGVDIILNSLSEQFVDKSFEVLAKGGRFIELGKLGIWDERKLLVERPDASYFPFDLSEVAERDPALIASMLKSIVEMVEAGTLKPLPFKVFPIQEVREAFHYMAQAKHIGKVVLSLKNQPSNVLQDKALVRHDSSTLITGGLGALGLKVADWLVEQGARHLVLAGRSGAGEPALRANVPAGSIFTYQIEWTEDWREGNIELGAEDNDPEATYKRREYRRPFCDYT